MLLLLITIILMLLLLIDDQWSVIMIKIMQVIIWVINMIMVKIHKITSIEERLLSFPNCLLFAMYCCCLMRKNRIRSFCKKTHSTFSKLALIRPKIFFTKAIFLFLFLSLSARGGNTALRLLHKISTLPWKYTKAALTLGGIVVEDGKRMEENTDGIVVFWVVWWYSGILGGKVCGMML